MNEPVNTQLVQQAYESAKAGDVRSLLNALDEEVQWHEKETCVERIRITKS